MQTQLFGLGLQSKSRNVTTRKLTNLYLEPRPEGERARVVAFGTPGLELFANLGDTPVRGMLSSDSVSLIHLVHRDKLKSVNNGGTIIELGTLNTSSGKVSLCTDGTTILIVDGTNGYTYNTSTLVFAQIADADFLNGAAYCTWLSGYFIVSFGNTFAISTDAINWSSLDRANAESNPDNIIAPFADHGQLINFGDISAEFWNNTGAVSFPFAPNQSATQEWGCASPWSITKFNDSVAFLAKNRLGQVKVARLVGFQAQTISSPDFDSIINGYSSVGDAVFYSYMLGGHPMLQMNFPGAGFSWLYDDLSKTITAVKGYGITRHRAELGINFINRTVVSDYENGNLYNLRPNLYEDNGEEIERELISDTLTTPDLDRFTLGHVRIDMETGVGLQSGQGTDPQVMLCVSRDGGHTYGTEMWATAGAVGKYSTRMDWHRLGHSNQFTLKARMTDPVKPVFINAMANPAD